MGRLFRGTIIAITCVGLLVAALRMTGLWELALSPGPHRAIDFEKLVLAETPNQYLVCPPNHCRSAAAHATSPVFDRSVDVLRAKFRWVSLNADDTALVSETPLHLDLVARTPLMRWPAWVSVQFIPLGPAKSTLAIYSRSVYGYGDFGANENRITAWQTKLSAVMK